MKTNQKINSSTKIELKPEYKEFNTSALVYATRKCLKHRKVIKSQADVKKYFDMYLQEYQDKKGLGGKLNDA